MDQIEMLKDEVVELKKAVQIMDLKQREVFADMKELLGKIVDNTAPLTVKE